MHPYRWLRPDLVPPAHFCSVILSSLLGVLADPAWIDEAFRKAWLPIFVVLGKGRPALRSLLMRLRVGCLYSRRLLCRCLLERCLLRLFIVRAPLLVVWMAGVGGIQGSAGFLVLWSCSYPV